MGRMVHYVARGSADGVYPAVCRAAVVTTVDKYQDHPEKFLGHVGLAVFNPQGVHFTTAVQGLSGGKWHWYTDCEAEGSSSA